MKKAWLPWLLFALVVPHFLGLVLEEGDLESALWLLPFGAYSFVGALVASRRPQNRLGWIYLLSNLFLAITSWLEVALQRASGDALRAVLTYILSVGWIGNLAMMIALAWLFFPDGRLPSPRWRPVLWLALLSLPLIALEDASRASPSLAQRLPLPLAELLAGVGTAGMIVATLGSALSLVARYRQASQETRQQIKWIVASVLVISPITLLVLILEENVAGGRLLPVIQTLLPLLFTIVPVAAGFAILRYRLYDIDVVIRKTLSYTLLSALLALVYLGSVILLQALFGGVTRQDTQVEIVLSTLAVAALFNPLRRSIQQAIDRRFYRRKYDTEKLLQRFSRLVRSEVQLEKLAGELLAVTEETIQPASISLWLKPSASATHSKAAPPPEI